MTIPAVEATPAPLDPLALLRAPETRLPLFIPRAFTMDPVPDDDPRWEQLRAKFGPNDIERKPQPIKKNDELKLGCNQSNGSAVSSDGYYCGGWHARSVHIKYVGHANLTMRLNEVVGTNGWGWLPMATNEDGTPKIIQGGMWIYLAILGHVKQGYGDGSGPDFIKVIIGDALRNAAMRFGIATYLWAKSDAALDKHRVTDEPQGQTYGRGEPARQQQGRQQSRQQQRPAPQQAAPARQAPPVERPAQPRQADWDAPGEEPTAPVSGPVVDAPAPDAPVGPPMPARPDSGQQAPPLRVAQARAWSAASLLYPTWDQATKQRVIEEALAAHMTKQRKPASAATADDWGAVAAAMEAEELAQREEADRNE